MQVRLLLTQHFFAIAADFVLRCSSGFLAAQQVLLLRAHAARKSNSRIGNNEDLK
jgi:hypothetical protein